MITRNLRSTTDMMDKFNAIYGPYGVYTRRNKMIDLALSLTILCLLAVYPLAYWVL